MHLLQGCPQLKRSFLMNCLLMAEHACSLAQYLSFAEKVSAAGITKKVLLREGKRMIRQLAIQTGTPLRVPPALIQQYRLHAVHSRLQELLARQFPSSQAIGLPAPPSSAEMPSIPEGAFSGASLRRQRRKSVAEEEYRGDIPAEAYEQRLFIISARQVGAIRFLSEDQSGS